MRYAFLFGFGGIGLACAIGGAVLIKGRINLANSGLRAQGVVVGHDSHVSTSTDSNGRSRNTTMYAERVEFSDVEGNRVTFTGETSSSTPDFGVGEKIDVIYPKANPRKAMIHSFGGFWMGPIVLTCFGLIFLTAGIFSFRHIGAIDKTFETPFFMHRKKNRGRFQQIEVMVTDVMVQERNGQVVVSLSLKGQDPKSGSRLEWITPPKSYTLNNVSFDRVAASQLRNNTLLLTYDPDNTSDYYFDIFQSSATRVA